jgi:SAM-dependent methyltransferase
MPILSSISAKRKCQFFLDPIPKDAKILEIGCGSGWVGKYLKSTGHQNYVGLDLFPPADIVGDIKNWSALGLQAGTFDVIVAFEVLEHEPCSAECYALLKPGGRVVATSPVPEMDWFLKLLETLKLNQQRTSPHDHLIDFRKVPLFELTSYKKVAGLSQWAIFTKPASAPGKPS